MTKHLTCVLDCNKTTNETLVQSIKWRPKMEGRTNNILMAVSRDTMYEWHTPSSKIISLNLSIIYIFFMFIYFYLGKIVNSLTIPDQNIYAVEYSNDGMNYALSLKDNSVINNYIFYLFLNNLDQSLRWCYKKRSNEARRK